jgi:DNA-binding winged helix-turn-helix (wHTH) protein
VVLPDETHLREQDKDLDSSLSPGEIDLRAPFAATAAQDVAGRLHEITVPISLSGYAGSVLGIIRVGFSGEYVSALIRHEQLLAAGIGSGSWVVLMAGLSVLLRVSQRRRSAALGGDTVIRCGSLAIDQRRREVLLEEKAIDLPPKLFALLLLFVRDPGAVLSDDDILHSLWAEASYATTADVKQCVYMLRQRFVGVHADPKRLIANVKGFGYRLDPNALDEDLTQI